MGARYYDPETALFLTFDPAGQFASPYAYGPWNPLGGVDPDGRIFETLAGWAITAMAVAAFVDTAIQTGDLGAALKAGMFSLFSAVVFSPVGLVVSALPQGMMQQAALGLAMSYQMFNAAQSASNGRYATAAASVFAVAVGIKSAHAAGAAGQGANQPSGLSNVGHAQGESAQTAVEALVLDPGDGSKSAWGHFATRIDDRVWTFGQGGWHKTPYTLEQYLQRNEFRDVAGLSLDLPTEQLATFRTNFAAAVASGRSYNALWYNCTDGFEMSLEATGVRLGVNVTPHSLGSSLIRSGLVSSVNYYPASSPAARGGGIVADLLRSRQ